MCNLYSNTTSQEAMRQLFAGLVEIADIAGNVQPGEYYPDQLAPIMRRADAGGGVELAKARWGMPTPPMFLKTARDPGVTNIRNPSSPHWRRWLSPRNRCLVPLTAFAEPRGKGLGNAWFAPADGGPAFFAGIETRRWTSTRKVKDGETTDDLFAFLTTAPNAEVAAVHPKAMPVILTRSDEWMDWLTADWDRAQKLQRPLPDDALVEIDGPV